MVGGNLGYYQPKYTFKPLFKVNIKELQVNMKNKIDYIYEYSDLNLFQTRVKILTGTYKDIILEFGGSYIERNEDTAEANFTFDYTLYQLPEHLRGIGIRENKDFIEYLGKLLQNIIQDKKNDKKEKYKLMEAASFSGVQNNEIKIDPSFYAL